MWKNKETATLTELQSIAGYLAFCSRAIRSGISFCYRIWNYIQYLIVYKHAKNDRKQHSISESVRLDLRWWNEFLHQFNGTLSIFPLQFPVHKLNEYTET